ncbi:MAG: hypothetical protein QXO22_01750 [Thermosphaera sp.]
MKKALIAIVGPVGVGKSTVIRLLSDSLREKGVSVITTYLKAFHGLSFVIWQLINKLMFSSQEALSSQSAVAPWYRISKLNEKLAWKLTLLTALIDTLLSIPLKLLQIHILRLVGCTVLCEEYLYGTLMDYTYMFINAKTREERKILSFTIKIFISELLKTKPHVTIVLDSNINDLFNRWKKRGYGDPQFQYVIFQKVFLNKLITRGLLPMYNFKVFYVDSSGLNESTTLRLVEESVY